VRSDLSGNLSYTEYAAVYPDGSPGTLTVDPTDPATGIQAFRTSSSACSDPTRGAEFDGVGRLHDGTLASFTVAACDNGPAGSGQDFFSVNIPSIGESRSGFLTAGDIAKSGSVTGTADLAAQERARLGCGTPAGLARLASGDRSWR